MKILEIIKNILILDIDEKIIVLFKSFLFFFIVQGVVFWGLYILPTAKNYEIMRTGEIETVVLTHPDEIRLFKEVNPVRKTVFVNLVKDGETIESYSCEGVLTEPYQIKLCKLIRNPNNTINSVEIFYKNNVMVRSDGRYIKSIIYTKGESKVLNKLILKKSQYSAFFNKTKAKNKLIITLVVNTLFLIFFVIYLRFVIFRIKNNFKNKFLFLSYNYSRYVLLLVVVGQLFFIWNFYFSLI